jgi:hypothetical protein
MPNSTSQSQPVPAPRTRVRLSGPGGLAAAIPYLLGFHPKESLVAVGLNGRPTEVCLAIRIDLPSRGLERPAAKGIATTLRRAQATSAALLVFTDADRAAGLPHRAFTEAAHRILERRRIEVWDVLCVSGGRWWSYGCEDPRCCPAEGSPVVDDPAGPLAVAEIAEGRTVMADREELVRVLAPAPDRDEHAIHGAFDAAEVRLTEEIMAVGRVQALRPTLDAIGAAVRARKEACPPLSGEDLGRFCVALADVNARDECLRWLTGELTDAAEGLWLELVRGAVAPYGAAPATLLGLYAYARGDGAFARICADHALQQDPAYSMAQLMHDALDRGISPDEIRDLCSVPVPP